MVANAQIVLSLGVILLGGFTKPLHRFHRIRRQAKLAQEKCQTHLKLGLGTTLFRLGAELGQRLAVSVALLGVQRLPGQHQGQANLKEQSVKLHNCFLFSFAIRELPQS